MFSSPMGLTVDMCVRLILSEICKSVEEVKKRKSEIILLD